MLNYLVFGIAIIIFATVIIISGKAISRGIEAKQNMKNKSEAVLRKPREAEQQRLNAKVDHAITMVRFNKRLGCAEGDNWRVVMTIEQYARLTKLLL